MFRMLTACTLVLTLFGEALAQQPAPSAFAKTPKTPREQIVYRMQHLPAGDVAETLSRLLNSERGFGSDLSLTIVPEPVTNSLLLGGSSEQIKQAVSLIEHLDRPAASVMLQALVADIWLPALPPPALQQAMEQLDSAGLALSSTRLFSGQGPQVLTPSALEKLESALKTFEQARAVSFLAHPRIMTLDDQPATIRLERSMPIEGNAPSSADAAQFVAEITCEVTLKVTPRVVPDGTVLLSLDMEQRLPGLEQKGSETKSLQTVVAVPDGQTVLLADLSTSSNLLDKDGGRRYVLLLVSPHVQTAKAKTQ